MYIYNNDILIEYLDQEVVDLVKKRIFLITFFIIMIMTFSPVAAAQGETADSIEFEEDEISWLSFTFQSMVYTVGDWFGIEPSSEPKFDEDISYLLEPSVEEEFVEEPDIEIYAGEEPIIYDLDPLAEPATEYEDMSHFIVDDTPKIDFEVELETGESAEGRTYQITMSHEGSPATVIDTGVIGSDGRASTTVNFNQGPGLYTFSAFTPESTKPETIVYVSSGEPINPDDVTIKIGNNEEGVDGARTYGDGSLRVGGVEHGWFTITVTDPAVADVEPRQGPVGTPINIIGTGAGESTELEIEIDGRDVGNINWNRGRGEPMLEVGEEGLIWCKYKQITVCEEPDYPTYTIEMKTIRYKNLGPLPKCIRDTTKEKPWQKEQCKGKKVTKPCKTKTTREPLGCPKDLPKPPSAHRVQFTFTTVSTGERAPCIDPETKIKKRWATCPGVVKKPKGLSPANIEGQVYKWMRRYRKAGKPDWVKIKRYFDNKYPRGTAMPKALQGACDAGLCKPSPSAN
ncbi:MAG: hypothetical protein KAT43_03650 [Nanoarchaeota archaeon]|nr:hypothetical protein [Nanoarchaeota archaeon]